MKTKKVLTEKEKNKWRKILKILAATNVNEPLYPMTVKADDKVSDPSLSIWVDSNVNNLVKVKMAPTCADIGAHYLSIVPDGGCNTLQQEYLFTVIVKEPVRESEYESANLEYKVSANPLIHTLSTTDGDLCDINTKLKVNGTEGVYNFISYTSDSNGSYLTVETHDANNVGFYNVQLEVETEKYQHTYQNN